METRASLKYGRISAQKMRLLADAVRGQKVADALTTLKLTPKKAAPMLAKVIRSAAANAADRHGADIDNLKVKNILVDGGPTMKRWTPRAQGRATPIRKRTSHVIVVVDDEA